MDFTDDQIPKIHSLGPILLGKEHIPYGRGQYLTQEIMGLQIHTQILPHLYIIRHVFSSVLLLGQTAYSPFAADI